jgi:hypothetical protein
MSLLRLTAGSVRFGFIARLGGPSGFEFGSGLTAVMTLVAFEREHQIKGFHLWSTL